MIYFLKKLLIVNHLLCDLFCVDKDSKQNAECEERKVEIYHYNSNKLISLFKLK